MLLLKGRMKGMKTPPSSVVSLYYFSSEGSTGDLKMTLWFFQKFSQVIVTQIIVLS